MVSDTKKRRLSALVLALAATFLVVELVVCLWFPSAWRHYTDYVGARFGGPLAALLLGMVLFALVVGLLWSRRKASNIAAVCLILSVILHMLTVTVFGLWVVRQKMIELAHQPEDRYELSFGLPSLVESQMSVAVRRRLLDSDVSDRQTFTESERIRAEMAQETSPRQAAELPEFTRRDTARPAIEVEALVGERRPVDDALVEPEPPSPESEDAELAQIQPEARAAEIEEPNTPAPVAVEVSRAEREHLQADPATPPLLPEPELATPERAHEAARMDVERLVEAHQDVVEPETSAQARGANDAVETASVDVGGRAAAVPRHATEPLTGTESPGPADVALARNQSQLPAPDTSRPEARPMPRSAPDMPSQSLAPAAPDGRPRADQSIEVAGRLPDMPASPQEAGAAVVAGQVAPMARAQAPGELGSRQLVQQDVRTSRGTERLSHAEVALAPQPARFAGREREAGSESYANVPSQAAMPRYADSVPLPEPLPRGHVTMPATQVIVHVAQQLPETTVAMAPPRELAVAGVQARSALAWQRQALTHEGQAAVSGVARAASPGRVVAVRRDAGATWGTPSVRVDHGAPASAPADALARAGGPRAAPAPVPVLAGAAAMVPTAAPRTTLASARPSSQSTLATGRARRDDAPLPATSVALREFPSAARAAPVTRESMVRTRPSAVTPAGGAWVTPSSRLSASAHDIEYIPVPWKQTPSAAAAYTIAVAAPTTGTTAQQSPGTREAGSRASLRVSKAASSVDTSQFADAGAARRVDPVASPRRASSRMRVDLAPASEATRMAVSDRISRRDVEGGGRGTIFTAERRTESKPLSRKLLYKLRSPEKRQAFIDELGGSQETETAVEAALRFLADTQSDDGRWDVDGFKGVDRTGGAGDQANGDTAITGLCLLTYLGAGYAHTEGPHQATMKRALDWLIEGQSRQGDLRRGGQMYGQAMATVALCEAYSLTRDKALLKPVQRAISFIMDAQNPGAVWRYQPRSGDNDTSVAGWQLLALKSAQLAGLKVPEKHFLGIRAWLDAVRKGEQGGLFSYKPGHGPTPVMTAEGWFCQLFMRGDTGTQGEAESIQYLMQNLPSWDPDTPALIHFYYWYYATLALHQADVPEFEAWNDALKAALLRGRVEEGPAAGSWDPVCQLGPRGGRIYATAMATLCLEVYYRYLPFYRQN